MLGDGEFVRSALEALVEFLKRFAAPTGARTSILLMWGGLIIIGFLFLTFLFRSAIVGDLAPVANARSPVPSALLPGRGPRRALGARALGFEDARRTARASRRALDAAFAALGEAGLDARVVASDAGRKLVRAYACPSCDSGAATCDTERGHLAGAFEGLTPGIVKVDEVRCRRDGASHCEFEVRHARLDQAVR